LIRNGQAVNGGVADKKLSCDSTVMVSAAALKKPELNLELCAPGRFHAMP
jgi:myo-inositol-1(or 4)-monophosphatase